MVKPSALATNSNLESEKVVELSKKGEKRLFRVYGGFPKMVIPNWPMGFPTKNDHDLGCEMGVPPFKETPIY